jgi:hypothetical protein
MVDAYANSSIEKRRNLPLNEVFYYIWDECVSNALTSRERNIGATTLINLLQFMRGDLNLKSCNFNLKSLTTTNFSRITIDLSESLYSHFVGNIINNSSISSSDSFTSLLPLCPFLLSSCDFYLLRALFLIIHSAKFNILKFNYGEKEEVIKIEDFHPMRDIKAVFSGNILDFYFLYLFYFF